MPQHVVICLSEALFKGNQEGEMYDVTRWQRGRRKQAGWNCDRTILLARLCDAQGDNSLMVRMNLLEPGELYRHPSDCVTIHYVDSGPYNPTEISRISDSLGEATVVLNGSSDLHTLTAIRIFDGLKAGELVRINEGAVSILEEK
jgi:hypothetical protein